MKKRCVLFYSRTAFSDSMTTFIYTKWEQGQLNLHIFKKTFVHPLVNDQVKVHWALKNAVRILKKNSENDGCQIWRKVVQKQLPIIINGFIFRDYLVKIKTKVVPTELPSYICQVGQKIRCHTLFEKKRRSDYFAVTFGLLQVICVKWGMSNHILHTTSEVSKGGCQSISTCSRLGYAFKALAWTFHLGNI